MHFHHAKHEEIVVEFPITTPWHENLEIKKEYVAQIRSIQHIEMRSMEKGYLQNIYVDEGQFVCKRQQIVSYVNLYKALGGGWRNEAAKVVK